MYKSYSEKISEIIESHAEDMVEKFARYISDQYEDMNADDLIKDFKKSEKSSSTSKKEEKKSSSSSKKENSSKKEDSPKNSSKGKSLKQKIAEAKKEDKYYNVKSGRKTKRTKQQENKGLVFYEDYNICGEKGSDKLKDALKELRKEDDESEEDKSTKENDKKSTKSKENQKFVENDQGNYEHEETGLVINPKTKKVFGKQDKDGDVLALTKEDIKACEKYRFKYTELTQEEINTNIMELTGFHQGSEKEEKSEINLD